MRVLVTNANSRMSLCATRWLTQSGHQVIVADFIRHGIASVSRFACKSLRYPSPYSRPDDFLAWVARTIEHEKIEAILPIHEETFLLSKHAKAFREKVRLCLPDYDALLSVHDKARLSELLDKLAIRAPKTVRLVDVPTESSIRQMFNTQILLKPRQGGGNWAISLLNETVEYAGQIDRYLRTNGVAKERVLLQEWIPVSEKFSHAVVYQDGRLVQDFADLHLRDFPVSGGAGCLRTTCEAGPFRDISSKLFDSVRWHGVAELEYVRHSETGELYLIEVNPRIWGGLHSALAAGLNIPELLLRIAGGEQVSSVHYATGVRTRWFWGHTRTLSHLRSFGELVDYAKSFVDGTKSDEFYWDDPLPFLVWPMHAVYKALKNRSIGPSTYDSLSGEWM